MGVEQSQMFGQRSAPARGFSKQDPIDSGLGQIGLVDGGPACQRQKGRGGPSEKGWLCGWCVRGRR